MIKITLILAVKTSDEIQTLECIESINQQNYDLNIIVVDGGCSTQVLNIINGIKKKNVTLIKSEPKGIYNAYNIGINKLDHGYAFFMGIDDRFYNRNSVLHAVRELEDERVPIFILTSFLEINSAQKKFPVLFLVERLFYRFSPMMHHQGLLVEAETLKRHKFNEELKIFADQEQFQTLKNKYKVRRAKVKFIISKVGGMSTSGSKLVEQEAKLFGFHTLFSRIIYKLFFAFR